MVTSCEGYKDSVRSAVIVNRTVPKSVVRSLLAEVYEAEDNEDEEHKTESQQAYEGAIALYVRA